METIKYLKEHMLGDRSFERALKDLEEDYGISSRYYPEAEIAVLNYSQIESPKFNPIVRECRSLVVSDKATVVSRAYDRFFNYGEGECEVNFKNAIVFEKVDGSLISLYYVPKLDEWHFRTRSMAFAESQLPSGRTYKEAIHETIGISHEKLQEIAKEHSWDKTTTIIFEFVSPENRIVTPYSKAEMVITGARDVSKESKGANEWYSSQFLILLREELEEMGFKNIRNARFDSAWNIEEVNEMLSQCKNLEEGFVVCDHNFNRVKIKSSAYLVAHKLRGEGLTPRRMIELIAENDHEEYLAVFPEDRQFFEKYIAAYDKMCKMVPDVYSTIWNIADQKEFALEAMKYKFSSMLFTMRKKNCPFLHAFDLASDTYRQELIQWFAYDHSCKASNSGI